MLVDPLSFLFGYFYITLHFTEEIQINDFHKKKAWFSVTQLEKEPNFESIFQISENLDGEWCWVTSGSGYLRVMDSETRKSQPSCSWKVQAWKFLSCFASDFLLWPYNRFFVYFPFGIPLQFSNYMYMYVCREWTIWNINLFYAYPFYFKFKNCCFLMCWICVCMLYIDYGHVWINNLTKPLQHKCLSYKYL